MSLKYNLNAINIKILIGQINVLLLEQNLYNWFQNLALIMNDRVSKTHGHTDACPRKIFLNPRKILILERKTGKTGTSSYLVQIHKVFFFKYSLFLYGNFSSLLCTKLY